MSYSFAMLSMLSQQAVKDAGGGSAATDAKITAALAALVGSAPAALDTLQEIDAQLAADEGSAAALAAAVAGKQTAAQVTAAIAAQAAADAATYQPFIYQLEAVPLYREGDSYDDGSQGADQASRPFARLALRHNMGATTKASVAGTRADQVCARIIANGWANKRGLIGLALTAINEASQWGNTTAGKAVATESLRTILAYLSAQGVSGLTSTALRFGPGWTTGVTSTTGSYVDVAFTTATAYLLVAGVTTTGGTATVKNAAGTTVASISTSSQAATTLAIKLTGSAGSTTTYRVALTSGSLTVVGVAAQSATPPLIVWDQAGPTLLASGTETARAAYITAMAAVLTDFPNVAAAPTASAWNAASMISLEDNTHRNDYGCAVALGQIEAAVRGALAARGGYFQGLHRLSTTNAAAAYTDPTAVYNGAGASVPAAPTGLAASAGVTQAVLTWADGTDGGATITSYTVQYRLTGAGSWTTFGTVSTQQATVTGLTGGSGYDFQVAATNTAGTGNYSSTATATPTSAPVTYSADTFTRADSTTSAGSTETGGQAWTAVGLAAALGISSNKLSIPTVSTPSNGGFALVNDSQASGTFTLTRGAIGSGAGGLFINTDATGATGYLLWQSSGTQYGLYKKTGASAFSSLGVASITPAVGDVLTIVKTGTTLVAKVNGTTIATVTDSAYAGTYHGAWSQSATTVDTWSHSS